MKTRTKRILILIGAMWLFAGAYGCRDVNPFPDRSDDYSLAYRQGVLLVTFEAEETEYSGGAGDMRFYAEKWNNEEREDTRFATECNYITGNTSSGGMAECIVQIPVGLLPTTEESAEKIEISAQVPGAGLLGRDRFVHSPQIPLNTAVPNDTDSDGIGDDEDDCADTPEAGREAIDENGCHDTDSDGMANDVDECDDTPAGAEIAENGCPPDANPDTDPVDTDGDGVNDLDESGAALDNCPGDRNQNQLDTDLDGIGDACDNTPGLPSGGPSGLPLGANQNPVRVPDDAISLDAGCSLAGSAAANPVLFLLLCGALLPLATLRRK